MLNPLCKVYSEVRLAAFLRLYHFYRDKVIFDKVVDVRPVFHGRIRQFCHAACLFNIRLIRNSDTTSAEL